MQHMAESCYSVKPTWMDSTRGSACDPTLFPAYPVAQYEVTPEILRFVWYVIWRTLRSAVVSTFRWTAIARQQARLDRVGSPVALVLGHAGRVLARKVGIRTAGSSNRNARRSDVLRAASEAWAKDRAWWRQLWRGATGPARCSRVHDVTIL